MIDISQKSIIIEPMDNNMKQMLAGSVADFHLPRYAQLPNMGLYLEQTTKYINQCLAPLGCMEITGSMIRNYVKMGLVAKPDQKQYYADQIAHLFSITILKTVLPLEYIKELFVMQKKVYPDDVAYDYLSMELENVLYYRFGVTDAVDTIGSSSSLEKEMLRSAVTSVSHIIYLNSCFAHLARQKQEEE